MWLAHGAVSAKQAQGPLPGSDKFGTNPSSLGLKEAATSESFTDVKVGVNVVTSLV